VSVQKDNTCGTGKNTKFAKQSILEKPPMLGKIHALSKPVTSNSVPTPQESKVVNNDKVIALGMFRINPFKTYGEVKHVPNDKLFSLLFKLNLKLAKQKERAEKESDEEEEEEHLAPADSAVMIPIDELASPPEGPEPIIPPPSTDTATTAARITIRPQTSISLPPEVEVERLLAIPTPPPSPLTHFHHPL
nr:hypothetical protein [Tanacetum cinerariifolium]